MKKNKTIKLGLVIAILLLSVGFATVTTKLNITGSASLKSNADEFEKNVVFANTDDKKPTLSISSSKTITEEPKVSDDGKQITFTTPELDSINETVTLSYYVENKSQYDLSLGKMTCTATYNGSGEAPTNAYVEVTPSNGYENQTLSQGTTDTADTVKIKMIRSYVGEEKISYNIACEMTATAIEK